MLQPRSKIHRLTASCLAFFLCWTQSLAFPPVFAQPAARQAAVFSSIPAEWGQITASYGIQGSTPSVMLIQDAHAVPDAQKSIRHLIRHFRSQGIQRVGLEGASGPVQNFFLRAFPDRKPLADILETYLNRGEISGAYAAALTDLNQTEYFGLENKTLYEQGIRLFLQALKSQPGILRQLETAQARLQEQKQRHYSQLLLALDAQTRSFRAAPEKFFETLQFFEEFTRNAQLKFSSSDYPHLSALMQEWKQTQNGSTPEVRWLIDAAAQALLKQNLHRGQRRTLQSKLQDYRTERLSSSAMAHELLRAAAQNQQDLPDQAAIEKLAAQFALIQKAKAAEVMCEIQTYENRIWESLLAGPEQQRIANEARRLYLIEKLVRLELTYEEWKEIQRLADSGQRIGGKEFLNAKRSTLNAHFRFYENAEAREEAFLQRIADSGQRIGEEDFLSAKRSTLNAMILVVGGFHTEGLAAKFKAQNISYQVIAPAVHEFPESSPYTQYMRGQVSWKHYFEVRNGKIDLEQAFDRAVRDQLVRSTEHGVPSLDPVPRTPYPVLKPWRDEIIRRLHQNKKISQAPRYTRLIDELAGSQTNSDALRRAWQNKVQTFLNGVEKLYEQSKLTPENAARLAYIPHAAAIPQPDFPAELVTDEALVRSELRNQTPNSETDGWQTIKEAIRREHPTMRAFDKKWKAAAEQVTQAMEAASLNAESRADILRLLTENAKLAKGKRHRIARISTFEKQAEKVIFLKSQGIQSKTYHTYLSHRLSAIKSGIQHLKENQSGTTVNTVTLARAIKTLKQQTSAALLAAVSADTDQVPVVTVGRDLTEETDIDAAPETVHVEEPAESLTQETMLLPEPVAVSELIEAENPLPIRPDITLPLVEQPAVSQPESARPAQEPVRVSDPTPGHRGWKVVYREPFFNRINQWADDIGRAANRWLAKQIERGFSLIIAAWENFVRTVTVVNEALHWVLKYPAAKRVLGVAAVMIVFKVLASTLDLKVSRMPAQGEKQGETMVKSMPRTIHIPEGQKVEFYQKGKTQYVKTGGETFRVLKNLGNEPLPEAESAKRVVPAKPAAAEKPAEKSVEQVSAPATPKAKDAPQTKPEQKPVQTAKTAEILGGPEPAALPSAGPQAGKPEPEIQKPALTAAPPASPVVESPVIKLGKEPVQDGDTLITPLLSMDELAQDMEAYFKELKGEKGEETPNTERLYLYTEHLSKHERELRQGFGSVMLYPEASLSGKIQQWQGSLRLAKDKQAKNKLTQKYVDQIFKMSARAHAKELKRTLILMQVFSEESALFDRLDDLMKDRKFDRQLAKRYDLFMNNSGAEDTDYVFRGHAAPHWRLGMRLALLRNLENPAAHNPLKDWPKEKIAEADVILFDFPVHQDPQVLLWQQRVNLRIFHRLSGGSLGEAQLTAKAGAKLAASHFVWRSKAAAFQQGWDHVFPLQPVSDPVPALDKTLPLLAQLNRSELRLFHWADRHAPELQDYSVVSRQFEMGLHRNLLKDIREKSKEYGLSPRLVKYVAQIMMTGGLGALMHDLMDAWKKNGVDVIGILPLYYNRIKGHDFVPDLPDEIKSGKWTLGGILKQSLEPTDIEFSIQLDISDEFRDKALRTGSKAKSILNREIKVKVYKKHTLFSKAPVYFLDAYILTDEGRKERVFDEVYPDYTSQGEENEDRKLWRDVHMAVYGYASEELILQLQQQKVLKDKLILVDNEVFASMPTPRLSHVIRHHINHTVFRPGLYSPDESSFSMLRYPREIYAQIVVNGKIDVARAVAMFSQMITGVGLGEHTPVLGEDIFSAFLHKLAGYNENGLRNTNGALAEQWQSPLRRQLIDRHRKIFNIPEEDNDKEVFEKVAQDPDMQYEFNRLNEAIAAADELEFLIWMKTDQNNPRWLDNTWARYKALKHIQDAGDPAEVHQRLQAKLTQAVSSGSREDLAALGSEFGWLIQVLMEDPVTSNVRRQVSYKGPEKWIELLQYLKNHPDEWRKFKAHAGRIIIGGRVFGSGAQKQFDAIKTLITELGLEDHIATIENYNNEDAPVIFRAMAATVMLSDEFLEAAATSMMKGLLNFAALIGVWGGAMPEIFRILKIQAKSFVNIFTEGIAFKKFHDVLVENQNQGIWKIVNGWLAKYSGAEMSKEVGGGRRPDALSLLNALYELQETYRDPELRRALQWNVAAGAYLVDMEKGQARAHIKLWQQAVKDKKAENEQFEGLHLSFHSVKTILETKAGWFSWAKKPYPTGSETHQVENGGPGILEFIASFHRARAKGKDFLDSLHHHGANARGEGDILTYLNQIVTPLRGEASMEPVTRLLDQWLEKHRQADQIADESLKIEAKAKINLRALDFMDRLLQHAAYQVMDAYLRPSAPEERAQAEDLMRRHALLREHLIAYLGAHPEMAVPLHSSSGRVKIYGMTLAAGEPVAVALISPDALRDQHQDKAWTDAYGRDTIQFLIGRENMDELTQVHQTEDVITEEKFGTYAVWELRAKGFRTGVRYDRSLQVLRLRLTDIVKPKPVVPQLPQGLPEILAAAVRGEFVRDGSETPADMIREMIQSRRNSPKDVEGLLRAVAVIPASEAKEVFGKERVPAVMALVASLAPNLLPLMKEWNPGAYSLLYGIVNAPQNADLFRKGDTAFHLPHDSRTSMMISRSLNGRRIFVPVHLSNFPYNPADGKVWFGIQNLEAYHFLDPAKHYWVFDHALKIHYPRLHSGKTLGRLWKAGVPVLPQKDFSGFEQNGYGFQMLEFVEDSPELVLDVQRSELRRAVDALAVSSHDTAPFQGLTRLIQQAGIQPVKAAFGAEAQNDIYVQRFASSRTHAPDAAEKFLADPDHADYETQNQEFVALQIARIKADALRYLEEHPKASLNFAFAFPVAGSDAVLVNNLRAYIEMLEELKRQSYGRVTADIRLLVSSSDAAGIQTLTRQLARQGLGKALVYRSAAEAAVFLNQYLDETQNALVYGLSEAGLDQHLALRHPGRIVRSALTRTAIFPVTAMLSRPFAETQKEAATLELLKHAPRFLPGVVSYEDNRLSITEGALQLVYQDVLAEQISSASA